MSLSPKKARALGRLLYEAYAAGEIPLEFVQNALSPLVFRDGEGHRVAMREFNLSYTGNERQGGAAGT